MVSGSGGRSEGGSSPRRTLFGLPGGLRGPDSDDELDLAQRATTELRAAATLMTDAQRVANFGSWEWRVDENKVSWSDQLYRIFGLQPGEFEANFDAYMNFVHLDEREYVSHAIDRGLRERRPFRFEHRVIRPNGEERSVRCHGEPIVDPASGEVVRVVGVCQDVTELTLTEQARANADARFRSAFENAPIGIALVDFGAGPEGALVQVNRSLCDLLGREESDLLGASFSELSLTEDAELDISQRERLLAGEIETYTVERRALLPGDRIVWLQMNVSVVSEPEGESCLGIVQAQDVTERKRFEEQLRHIADHDSLTGLLNRRRFREELDTQIALRRRYGGEGALLLLDVDGLKQINDTRGHGAGDTVLRRVAEILRARSRTTDVVARLAGDEFAVLLPNANPNEAQTLADSLSELIGIEEVAGAPISVSIGIAGFGSSTGTAEDAMTAADAAMYEAKLGGTVGVVLAGSEVSKRRAKPPPGVPRRSRVGAPPSDPARGPSLVERVRTALEHEGLVVYWQPAIDLRTGRIAHHELLVRMRASGDRVVPAADFMGAAAQERGLCEEIDRWVVERAIALLGNGARSSRVQVNLSGETVASESALRSLAGAVDDADVDPGLLAFEVGETSITRDVDAAESALGALASTGCPLVLDGFSAAFGSFELLQRLPLDQIKIDGSLVQPLGDDDPDGATVRAIVRLAQGTEKTTVAKLVDSEAIVPVLRMYGVDQAQGYAMGEPVPA